MPQIRFTDTAVAKLKADAMTWYSDPVAKGLQLSVTPGGTKTWYVVKWDPATQKKQALDRAKKIGAAPPWLTQHHLDTISMIFGEAWMRSNFCGQTFVVDHIVPLQGRCPITKERNVCGLHVPWNLRPLPESANRKKADWFVSDWVVDAANGDGDDEIPF